MQQAKVPADANVEALKILEKLEALTSSATKLPLTNRAVLNPADLNALCTALKKALPKGIAEAQQIIRFKDSILTQAHAEAKRIKSDADEQSMTKLSDTQVVRDSRATAERIIAEAREQAGEVLERAEEIARQRLQGADDYADDVLEKLEGELGALLATARRGREILSQERETPPSNGVAEAVG